MTVDPVDLTRAGERIELLLEASAAAGPVARERAEELVRLVVELYGAGLERILEIAHDRGVLDEGLLEALASDPLVSSLLVVHDLHPYGVRDRVERALAGIRPAVAAEGASVEVTSVAADAIGLRLVGAGSGCGSSAPSLADAIAEAVRAAVPEVLRVEVEQSDPALIPVSSLTSRLREGAIS